MTQEVKNGLTAVGKTIKQVNHHSGRMYHFNIDDTSIAQLEASATKLKELNVPVSLSVLIRRAIRVYSILMDRLDSDEKKVVEGFELFKCASGV